MNVVYEKTGIHYRQEGEYALPDLEAPESPKVGICGERRHKYMREHQKARYILKIFSVPILVSIPSILLLCDST